MNSEPKLRPMPLWESVLFFGIPTVILYLTTQFGIAFLRERTSLHGSLIWFINGGPVFVLLFLTSIIGYRLERGRPHFSSIKERFRLERLKRNDWLWTLWAFLLALISMGGIFFFATLLSRATPFFGNFDPSPAFIQAEALDKRELWILLAWLPHFFFNIVGEEFLWRGYILPRQELTHGRFAWIVQGVLWSVFHYPLSWQMILLMLPVLFGIPFVVQKRENTWIGIILHGVINGGAFVAISFGLI